MARRKNKGSLKILITILCIIGVVLIFAFGTNGSFTDNIIQIWNNTIHYGEQQTNVEALVSGSNDGQLLMYVINTGNSDSIVVRTPDGQGILIDAADDDDASLILATLKDLGITRLSAAVATHPDADHIGSMDDVLEAIPTDKIYMTSYAAQTKTYDNMIDAISESGTKEILTFAGDSFEIGSVLFQVLSPQETELEDSNNSSIVLLMQYGATRFLLEGDAETEAIGTMLAAYAPEMDIDVIKIGHHGSSNATTEELLDASTPSLAVITCGEGNDYGHPHRETLDLLQADHVKSLRTDENGDIAIFSDGNEITYKTAA
ncbi:MAG: ComEC/Rec2 family competence protein [Christensenella sp.]|nr:ComEC/Rec2 family competence protein [Christensenella sp.]